MFDINEPPVVRITRQRFLKQRRLFIYFIFFVFFASFSYIIFSGKSKRAHSRKQIMKHINSSNNPKPIIPLPNVDVLAHLDNKYSNYSIPENTLIELWNFVQKSPINPKTGQHYIMYSIANAGLSEFILNCVCSMRLANIPSNYHVTIALDFETYEALQNIGANVILWKSNFIKKAVNNVKIVEFYNIIKVKPTILHQFLLWNVEPILVDADTIFNENPLHLFNDEVDFQVQCDSKEYYEIPYNVYPVPWQVNLGFYKVRPSSTVMKLMPVWLERMYNSPKVHDQSSLRKILKEYPTKWVKNDTNDTVIVDTTKLFGDEYPNLTFRFLDPMLITNAGGLFMEGRYNWSNQAQRLGLKRPEFIHFFHCGKNALKKSYMRDNDMWFIDKDKKCLDHQPEGSLSLTVWR
ncbi:hypothetical protein TRFO_05991 [Tritrichomonas foetus]|uniref:Nucleotide-diphospho-sugar transferase domain-containing protein n=1 Tax=Tritrichomonas foetus TaxID=1144522 RepID=A0A1J4K1X3_9EUKA|nr:hypothetical protein TRFO_05991 [Tritrichomonas foetus]|eukprot:OHT05391.1 hypothetical protein TRFO_05991 [Tritrichomonas foetus]